MAKTIVGRAEEMELDPTGGPWCAICDVHGSILNVATRAEARSAAREPESFCDGCREELDARGSVEA